MKIWKLIAVLSLPLLLNSGCGTKAPKTARATQASYSATQDPVGSFQTSGVCGFRTNGDLIIDSTGRDAYNTLIVRGYGIKLTPPVTNADWGLTSYTNDPVESLVGLNHKMTPQVKNPGNLYDMNPPAKDAWPTMTELSRQPIVNKPP